MITRFFRNIGGLGSVEVPDDVAAALHKAFPSLDDAALAYLYRQGAPIQVAARQLVSDMDDPTPRVVLLVNGGMTVERPHLADIEVSDGIVWNELTWATMGRVNGGRLYASADGASLVEWKGKNLRSIAANHPALYGALLDALMRCVGVRHTLQLRKARFVPPASLWRGLPLTLDEILQHEGAGTHDAADAARTAA